MADWFAAGDSDSPTKALGFFTQAGRHRLNARGLDGENVLLNHGCPDGANVGVATQDRDQVGFTVLVVFDLSNKPIQPQSNSRTRPVKPGAGCVLPCGCRTRVCERDPEGRPLKSSRPVLASRPAAVSPVLLVRPLSLLWIPKLLFDVRKV
jgi:hypothetical protein